MPRTRTPKKGNYLAYYYGHHPNDVNGTVKAYRRRRKSMMRRARESRRVNRERC
jgi:UDP-N-acetylmuramate-alanine ligase